MTALCLCFWLGFSVGILIGLALAGWLLYQGYVFALAKQLKDTADVYAGLQE